MKRNTNKKIIEELYQRHAAQLLRRAYAVLFNKSRANDILHNVFVKLLNKTEPLTNAPEARNLLFKMFHDELVDDFRREGRWRLQDIEKVDGGCLRQAPRQEDDLIRSRLAEQSLPLPKHMLGVFEKAYFEGMTDEEIAADVGLKVRSVRYILELSRKYVTGLLKNSYDYTDAEINELLNRKKK